MQDTGVGAGMAGFLSSSWADDEILVSLPVVNAGYL